MKWMHTVVDVAAAGSHPARGGWIEILPVSSLMVVSFASHPARGGWIEIADGAVSCSGLNS